MSSVGFFEFELGLISLRLARGVEFLPRFSGVFRVPGQGREDGRVRGFKGSPNGCVRGAKDSASTLALELNNLDLARNFVSQQERGGATDRAGEMNSELAIFRQGVQ